MSAAPAHSVTRLLEQANTGDASALPLLLSLVYDELRAIAARSMRGERASHTLRPTALVHEAYLRLVDQRSGWQNRRHFFAIAAQAMRRVLVDHARAHEAAKRGAALRVDDDLAVDRAAVEGPSPAEILDVHRALTELEALDPFEARIVELKYFAGLTIEEIADALESSPATIKREWSLARAWLHQRLAREAPRGR